MAILQMILKTEKRFNSLEGEGLQCTCPVGPTGLLLLPLHFRKQKQKSLFNLQFVRTFKAFGAVFYFSQAN